MYSFIWRAVARRCDDLRISPVFTGLFSFLLVASIRLRRVLLRLMLRILPSHCFGFCFAFFGFGRICTIERFTLWRRAFCDRSLKALGGCQSAANARVELEWSLLGIWAMSLYASAILFARGVALKRLSFAGVLHAFQEMARDYLHQATSKVAWRSRIAQALIDPYKRRNKSNRGYACKRRLGHAGKPDIRRATAWQRKRAKQIALNP